MSETTKKGELSFQRRYGDVAYGLLLEISETMDATPAELTQRARRGLYKLERMQKKFESGDTP